MRRNLSSTGFTLIELLVVISIIGFLAVASMAALDNSRKKARDARRLADMKTILNALNLYYDSNNQYPSNTDGDYAGWDTGYYGAGDTFISPLESSGIIKNVPGDPSVTSQSGGYNYYRYGAGADSCDAARGPFFVLGIRQMETNGRPFPGSPGWSCAGGRDWTNEFDWVTGGFEK